jgi:hypothetical protein
MEAFEKYRATRPDYECMIHDCKKCHKDAESIWRVAMEQALFWMENSGPHARIRIRKELEDRNEAFETYRKKYLHVDINELLREFEDESGDYRHLRICSERGYWP